METPSSLCLPNIWAGQTMRVYNNKLFVPATGGASKRESAEDAFEPPNLNTTPSPFKPETPLSALKKQAAISDSFKTANVSAYGISDAVLKQLQNALAHRHRMVQAKSTLLAGLWQHIQHAFAGSPEARKATVDVQLLLDIDHTLVTSEDMEQAHEEGSCGDYEDPDKQLFYDLGAKFWKWTDEAAAAFKNKTPWPTWMPSAMVNGRSYTMWLPKSAEGTQYPVPELIAPMWGPDGNLTHYIAMYGGCFAGESSMRFWQFMSTIPAEITILTYLRFELAADLDRLRPRQDAAVDTVTASDHQADDCSSIGHTTVELRLATCGAPHYAQKIHDILQDILGCAHNGKVCTELASYSHRGTLKSCKGVKNLKPFNLKNTGDGIICPRLVLDDHIEMWAVEEGQHQLKLMPTKGWYGRWNRPADSDSDDDGDSVTTAQAAASQACHHYGALSSQANTTGVGHQSGKESESHAAVCCLDPVAKVMFGRQPDAVPEGLTNLLPEVLQLVAQELKDAKPKMMLPVAPSITTLQRQDSAASTSIEGSSGTLVKGANVMQALANLPNPATHMGRMSRSTCGNKRSHDAGAIEAEATADENQPPTKQITKPLPHSASGP